MGKLTGRPVCPETARNPCLGLPGCWHVGEGSLAYQVTVNQAALWTGRSRKSIQRLYERDLLDVVGRDRQGRVLLNALQVSRLGYWGQRAEGNPADLLAAPIPDLLAVA